MYLIYAKMYVQYVFPSIIVVYIYIYIIIVIFFMYDSVQFLYSRYNERANVSWYNDYKVHMCISNTLLSI